MFEEGIYKVSILIPVYGVEQYIERCARSLFGQTYSNLEYVFVNDCTPDKSVEILRQVMEDYPERKASVRIIDHENNRGLAAARNTALDNATGKFVCHVDSDDWLELNAIELLVEKQKETDADIVSGNMFVHTDQGLQEYYEPRYESKEQMMISQLPATFEHNAVRRIIRRSLYENYHIRCIEGADVAEDRYQMVMLCWFADNVSTIDRFVYHYDRLNLNSITAQKGGATGALKDLAIRKIVYYEKELVNWTGITSFLCDKDNMLYVKSIEYTVDCVQKIINLSIRYKAKDHYIKLLNVISEHDEYRGMLGWKEGRIGLLMHNYSFMRVVFFVRRLGRLILRGFLRLKQD